MIFFVMMTTVAAVVNRYLWQRLVRDTRLSPRATRTVSVLLFALAVSVPATLVCWKLISRAATPVLTFVAFGWLGISFYLVALFLGWDVVRVVRATGRRLRQFFRRERAPLPAPAEQVERETRRVFVARTVAGSALLAAGGVGAFGLRSAVWNITTPEIAVKLPRLPRELDGFSIALLTDVHIGPMLDGRFLRHLVEQTNGLRPDLICIGGDLVDGRVSQIGAEVAELRRLRARHGVYFVTGNHEYYSVASQWIEFLPRLGVRVLMNEHVSIGDAAVSGASFDLGGMPDLRAPFSGENPPDVVQTVLGRDPERELVMLAHQPLAIGQSAQVGAGLQLSGHTHGGQLFPFGAAARLMQPYLAGLHRHAPTDTQIYVSCGTGFWGPPLRVLAPAEITLLRLYAA